MAPRKPEDDDDASSLASEVLKPKTAKAKVTKPKADKPKVTKPKADKPKVEKVKVEKVKKESSTPAPTSPLAASGLAASPSIDGDAEMLMGGDEKEVTEEKVKVKKAAAPRKKAVKKEKVDDDMDVDESEEDIKPKKKPAAKKEPVKKDAKLDKDGKEKVKPVNGEEAVQMMLAYLKEQNRPYSATEVSANLHNKVTKTVADKLLKEMENNGQIMGKATKKDGGGQWVFWTLQDASDAASPEELLAMESSIATTKEALPALRTTFKTLTTALNAILSAPTTTELVVKIQELELENAAKKAKLQGFEDGSIKMVTKEELDRTEREHKYWAKVRKGRKDAGRNLWRMLADNLGEDKLREEVELDEDPYVG